MIILQEVCAWYSRRQILWRMSLWTLRVMCSLTTQKTGSYPAQELFMRQVQFQVNIPVNTSCVQKANSRQSHGVNYLILNASNPESMKHCHTNQGSALCQTCSQMHRALNFDKAQNMCSQQNEVQLRWQIWLQGFNSSSILSQTAQEQIYKKLKDRHRHRCKYLWVHTFQKCCKL